MQTYGGQAMLVQDHGMSKAVGGGLGRTWDTPASKALPPNGLGLPTRPFLPLFLGDMGTVSVPPSQDHEKGF